MRIHIYGAAPNEESSSCVSGSSGKAFPPQISAIVSASRDRDISSGTTVRERPIITIRPCTLACNDSRYPRFVDGERREPPEDVGGPPGFEQFLEAMAKPRHPEHKSVLQWYGRHLNPITSAWMISAREWHPPYQFSYGFAAKKPSVVSGQFLAVKSASKSRRNRPLNPPPRPHYGLKLRPPVS